MKTILYYLIGRSKRRRAWEYLVKDGIYSRFGSRESYAAYRAYMDTRGILTR